MATLVEAESVLAAVRNALKRKRNRGRPMTVETLRKRLHQAIEKCESKATLESLYNLLNTRNTTD